MKKAASIIFIICLCLFTVGCNNAEGDASSQASSDCEGQENPQVKTEILLWKETAVNASGNIMHTTVYDYDGQGRKISDTVTQESGTTVTRYEYDENGFLSKKDIKTKGGSFIYCCVYENDSNGKVLRERTLNEKGELLSETVNTYDENGRIKEITVDGKASRSYTYEADGSYTETYINLGGYYIYDKDGNPLKYKDESCETTYSYTDSLLTKSVTVFDDAVFNMDFEYRNGMLTRRTEYENGEITRIFICEYDDNMRITKDCLQNSIGVTVRTTTYEHKEFPIENQ